MKTRQIVCILVVLILSFTLVGCQYYMVKPIMPPVFPEPPQKTIEKVVEVIENEISEEIEVITAVQDDPSGDMQTKLSEFSIDFDEDGVEEIVALYKATERYTDGEMMWDDGQQWLLVVEDDDVYYPLYKDYVQLGQCSFEVYYDDENNLNINFIMDTGMGTKVSNYSFLKEKSGFVKKVVYDTGAINKVFSSVPLY